MEIKSQVTQSGKVEVNVILKTDVQTFT